MMSACCYSLPAAAAASSIIRGVGFHSRSTNSNDRGGSRGHLAVVTSAVVPRRCSAAPIVNPEVANKPLLLLSSIKTPEARMLDDILLDDEGNETKILLSSIALGGGRHYCIGSSEGFTIFFDEDTQEVIAVNPLTGQQLPIPSTATLKTLYGWNTKKALYLSKAILSPSRSTLVIIINDKYNQVFRDHIFCQVGGSRWASLLQPCNFALSDCIFHKGLLYCISPFGSIAVYDLEHPIAPPFFSNHPRPGPLHKEYPYYRFFGYGDFARYFVESPDGNDLFVAFKASITREDHSEKEQVIFSLFKLGKDDLMWEEVEDIGNLALVLGLNRSVALPASDDDSSGSIKSNCIYFTNRYPRKRMNEFAGVFDLRGRSLHYFEFDDGISWEHDHSEPVWFMPSST